MIDLIVGIVILAILALAIGYIIRAKKAGVKCIGCSAAGKCASTKPTAQSTGCDGGCSGCGGDCGCGS